MVHTASLDCGIPGFGSLIDIACYLPDGQVFATGSRCTPVAARPPDFLGSRELDLQVTKDVDLGKALALYVRLDLLNVFNNTNYADYNSNYGNTGVPPRNPVTFNQIGNILGTPRTLKLQAGVRF
jgi:hypothetical protein